MKQHHKTTGIVLRRIDFSEADQIITVLSEDFGKIALVARGSRRLKSKLAGSLGLLDTLHLSYFQGQSLGYLNDVEPIHSVETNELDLKTRGLLFYMAEATQKLIPEGEECHAAFQLLKNCLMLIDSQQSEVLFYAYMVKLLTLLGFMGQWDHCRHTDQKIDLSIPYFLSVEDASIVHREDASDTDFQLSPSVIKWVNYIQKNSVTSCVQIQPSQGERAEVFFVLKSVLGTILNHPFKSEQFLQALH